MDGAALARTADVVEASTGPPPPAGSALVRASIPLHLAGVAIFAGTAFLWSGTALLPILLRAPWLPPALLVTALAAAVYAPRSRAVATVCLLVVPLLLGASIAALVEPRLPGAGPATAVCVVAGECAAAALLYARHPRLAAAAALLAPVVLVPLLVLLAERGLTGGVASTPWGIGAAAVLADAVAVAARAGEGAAPWRHAPAQKVEAALSRFLELPRSLLLFVHDGVRS